MVLLKRCVIVMKNIQNFAKTLIQYINIKIYKIGCSQDRGGVAICTDRDPLSDGCKYNYIEPSFDCRDSTL